MSFDVAPVPYGHNEYDMRGSYQPNDDHTSIWLLIVCPSCQSENVVGISPDYNDIPDRNGISSRGLWYCISCGDSWRYERE